MSNIKLIRACEGKTSSQGGLNIAEFKDELKKLFPELVFRINNCGLRSMLHDICKERGIISHTGVPKLTFNKDIELKGIIDKIKDLSIVNKGIKKENDDKIEIKEKDDIKEIDSKLEKMSIKPIKIIKPIKNKERLPYTDRFEEELISKRKKMEDIEYNKSFKSFNNQITIGNYKFYFKPREFVINSKIEYDKSITYTINIKPDRVEYNDKNADNMLLEYKTYYNVNDSFIIIIRNNSYSIILIKDYDKSDHLLILNQFISQETYDKFKSTQGSFKSI